MRDVSLENQTSKKLQVAEIFKSIQGESTWAGVPCVFVRLAGCNLRCRYCDTTYAYDGGSPMSVSQILDRCASLGGPLVEITGGEPLVQEACPALAACLIDTGYTVLVETNGSLPITRLPAGAIRILDVKCPGSGCADSNLWSNLDAIARRDEVKFVVTDRTDYEWSRDVVQRYDLSARCNAVLFSPAFGALEPRDLAAWMLADQLNVRFQLQLHRYIWPADQRGV